MRIWIDAEPVSRSPRLFGFSTLERILRSIAKMPGPLPDILVSGLADAEPDNRYSSLGDTGPVGTRLADFLKNVEGPVLALDGGAVIDPRLLPLLMQNPEPGCFMGDASSTTAILRLSSKTVPPADAPSLRAAAERLVQAGTLREIAADEMPNFISTLRRNVPFTLEVMTGEQDSAALEKRLFWLNYKGSTDFMTKWVYPPIVWPLVKLCIRWQITPNMVTFLGIFLAAIAVPLFAGGYWLSGLAAAYGMTILDSVDGKLARLTLTDSPIGNILDHGLDIVHPPFWYAAWAMGLVAGGKPELLYTATFWLIFFYIADRLALMVAKKRFKRGLHALTPLDGFVRTWIARRNVNLVVITLGLIFGVGDIAFLFITVWQGLTFVWHAFRTFWLYPHARHAAYLT